MGWRGARRWGLAAVLLGGMCAIGVDATSIARLPPSPSKRSRANDTPVVDHAPGGGPDGGSIDSVAIVATTPSTVFVSTRGGGVYASADHGATWRPADRGLPDNSSCDLVADPVSASTLYAACVDGLFKTTTRGTLWRQLDIDWPLRPFIAPSDPRLVYQPPAFWNMVRSVDGGRRWREFGPPPEPLRCAGAFAVDPFDGSRLYCAGPRGLRTSADGGVTWAILPGLPVDAVIAAFAADPAHPGVLLAAASDGRMFRSTTRGKSWGRAADAPDQRGFHDLRFVGRTGRVVFARQHSRLFRSIDGGGIWAQVPPGWDGDAMFAFAVDPADHDTVFVGTLQGMLVTTDGGVTWTARNQGLTRAATHVTMRGGATSTLVASVGRELFASRNDGASWTRLASGGDVGGPSDSHGDGSPAPAAMSRVRPVAGGGFSYWSDIAGRWLDAAPLPYGLPPRAVAEAGTSGSVFASSGSGIAVKPGSKAVWKSDDTGQTWRLVASPAVYIGADCCGLLVDPNDPDTVFAIIGNVGIGGGGDQVMRTTDGGLTWTDVRLPGLSVAFSSIPTSPTTFVAALYGGGLVVSTNRGDRWSSMRNGLPEASEVTSVVADPRRLTTLFAGTASRGVYRSLDGGKTWRPTGRVD